jgi:hypothetical protein
VQEDVCKFRLFLWHFDGFFRKPLEDFPPSSIFNTAGLKYLHATPWSSLQWCEHYLQCSANGGKNHRPGNKFSPNIKRLCNGEYRPGQLYMKTLLNFVVNWFTLTKNGFLFFFILKMENVGLSVDFHWTLWKSSRPLIYLMSAGFTFSYHCGNTFIIRAHFSTYIYAYKVRNNASFIIVNSITVDSIIFVGINFRKLKNKKCECKITTNEVIVSVLKIFY